MILEKNFTALQTVKQVEMDPSDSIIMKVSNGQLELMKRDRIILGSHCGNRACSPASPGFVPAIALI